ncbi:hypothetical protein NDI76_14605 [Halogeometricum sp. S1BR25-6]|uniref:Uncharacterized protein n=1 Tax=Halogeometricum salsisoli TaxID=2950536 RepID=A0ABU2GHT2_9EURY|nr:hypothetical protein [Halogeometricum sp. S1BR25-6]MDS0299976.1 hypothetical protein [Halogeometricum sp. S1BR25-6]
MTDSESDSELAVAFEDAATTAEEVHAEGDDELDGERAETLRDPAERLADALSEASLSELLAVTGFEDAPDDVSPVDLPAVIRDADPDAIVELRTLLQLADLGESWSDLSAEERAVRVDRVVGDAQTADDGGVALEEYIDRLGHILGGDEASGGDESTESDADGQTPDSEAADATDAEDEDPNAEDDSAAEDAVEAVVGAAADAMAGDEDEESADDGGESEDAEKGAAETVVDAAAEAVNDDGDDSDADSDPDPDSDSDTDGEPDADGDDELFELEDHVDRLRQLVGDDEAAAEADADADAEAADVDEEAAEADAVEEAEDDAEKERADDDRTRSTSGSRGRLSTVPSSRSDMGKSGRFSTARGKR